MRFKGLALVVSAFAFVACGGKDNGSDTATATTPSDTAASATATPAAGTATGTTAAAAPITGKTWDVKMIGDDKGYRFEPAELKIKAGDGVKWTMVTGGPHNVAFDANAVGAAANALTANMPNQMSPLSSPYLTNPNETYTVSFAGVPAGTYDYTCTPHSAMGMHGKITVEQ